MNDTNSKTTKGKAPPPELQPAPYAHLATEETFLRLYLAALNGMAAQFETYHPSEEADHDDGIKWNYVSPQAAEDVEWRCERMVNRAYLLAREALDRLRRRDEEEDIEEFNDTINNGATN